MKIHKSVKVLVIAAFSFNAAFAFAQSVEPKPATPEVWKYQAKQLNSNDIDVLLRNPEKLLVIDVRRPDELTAKGSFPVYLNIQAKDLEKNLAYIPKDRTIITVSNHAHRAGVAADILVTKGYKVAGAAGSEDYEAQGGKAIVKISVPVPKAPTITASNK